MMKRLNIKKIIIFGIILIGLHYAVGLFLSPKATAFIVEALNQKAQAKVSLEKANLWPLTFTVSLTDAKIFDPKDSGKCLINIPKGSLRLSLVGLLQKRLVISQASLDGAVIALEGRADGTFNVQDLGKTPEGSGKTKPFETIFSKDKKDVFGRIYELIRKKFSKEKIEEQKQVHQAAKKVTKEVEALPRGKRVHFKTLSDRPLFELQAMDISHSTIEFKSGDDLITISDAQLKINGLDFDPQNGLDLARFLINGSVSKGGVSLGGLFLSFLKTLAQNEPSAEFDIKLKDVNLEPLRFIYENSLPVEIVKGTVNLNSKSLITGDRLDSRNELSLSDHALKPKSTTLQLSKDFMPLDLVCDALNTIDPVHLNFNISGTVQNPEYSGFKESLNKVIQPALVNIKEKVKQEGMKSVDGLLKKGSQNASGEKQSPQTPQNPAPGALQSIQSIFGTQKQTQQ